MKKVRKVETGYVRSIINVKKIASFHECMYVWSEPSVRRISTSVSVCVGMCSVVAMQADP